MTVSPQNLTVNQTDNAVFTCTGFGIPLPTLTWFNNSIQLEDSDTSISITETVEVNALGFQVSVSQLTIISVQKAIEVDIFMCSGNNSVIDLINSPDSDYSMIIVQGRVYSTTRVEPFLYCCYLSVVPPTVIVDSDQDVLVLVGGITILEFLINDASPSVLIQDITLLFDNGENVIDVTADIRGTITPSRVTHEIVSVEHDDEGNYTLIAINAAGRSQATISIEVQGECTSRETPQPQPFLI